MVSKTTPAPTKTRRQSPAASSPIETTGVGRVPTKSAAAPKRAPLKPAAPKAALVAETVETSSTKPVSAPGRSSCTPLSAVHKAALGIGREQGRIVRIYLETLERNRPKRGRRRTPESIKRRLSSLDDRLAGADALAWLHLAQERHDLESELEGKSASDDLGSLEEEFVKIASEYGKRKGITYSSWRDAGVSAATLRKAAIGRSGRS